MPVYFFTLLPPVQLFVIPDDNGRRFQEWVRLFHLIISFRGKRRR